MRRKYINSVLMFFAVLVLSGCAREVYNISWNGVIADKTTGQPVPHARIAVSSSYQFNIDETAEIDKYDISDESGRFRVSFPKGFGLTVRVSAPQYLSELNYKVVKRSSLQDTIFISPHPFNASLVVRISDFEFFGPSIPFIRECQINGISDGKREIVKWGFDFLTGRNTNNIDSADVWVEVNNSNGQVVINSAPNGGLFAVYENASNDFLTHVTKAPASGYVKNHSLKGDEAGFFVLCRNGTNVAKMIPEKQICVLKYKKENGNQVKETGIRFDYLFQPDLENRLYFPVSASAASIGHHALEFPENNISISE